MSSSSSVSSSRSSTKDSPRAPQPKRQRRQRSKYSDLSDSSSDDDSSSGDAGWLAMSRTPANVTTNSVSRNRIHRPEQVVTVSGKRMPAFLPQSLPSSSSSESEDSSNNDNESVSTDELARRVRGLSAPPPAAASSNKKNKPNYHHSPLRTSITLPTLTPKTNSTAINTTTTQLTRQSSTTNNLHEDEATSSDDDDALLSKPIKGKQSSVLPTKTTKTKETPTQNLWENPDDDDEEEDDDESSVSTAELARRVRGDPPRKRNSRSQPPPRPLTIGSEIAVAVAADTVAENHEDDLILPSPLPSSDEDDSGSEDDNNNKGDISANRPSSFSQRDGGSAKGLPNQNHRTLVETPKAAVPAPGLQPVVREGLHLERSPPGVWAQNRRQINATGSLFPQRWTMAQQRMIPSNEGLEEDIEAFSDEEKLPNTKKKTKPKTSAKAVRTPRTTTASTTATSAHVFGGYPPPAANTNPSSFSVAEFSNLTSSPLPPRNDLAGGSGVGAGSFQLYAPTETSTRASRGRGRTRGTRNKRSGRGPGRRRGSYRGRGRGGRRGRGSTSAGTTGGTTYHTGNAWADYSTQGTSWATSGPQSDLGNVGGADISF